MNLPITRWGLAARLKLEDALRYSVVMNEMIASTKALRAKLARDPGERLDHLTRSYRLTNRRDLEERLLKQLAPALQGDDRAQWAEARVGWNRYPRAFHSPELNRTIVLKTPAANGEKGVLLIMLEDNFLKLLAHAGEELAYLDQHYDLIASTGWSPTDYAILGLGVNSLSSTFFLQSCNYGEIEKIEKFHPRVKCLTTIACDWVHPGCYHPKPFSEREYDLLMVANWAPFKRHWDFFLGLAELPVNTRIAMIGQPAGKYTIDTVRRQARALGVRQDIEYLDSIPIERVQEFQCNSKASLILSRREGCCVAVVESLFADSPVGLMRNAHIGPKAYIHDETGVLLDSSKMGKQLRDFVERSQSFRARDWASENISCFQSIDKLESQLRDHAIAEGRPWTTGLKMPVWRPFPTYVNSIDAEEMRPAYEELHRRLPVLFSEKLLTSTVKSSDLATELSLV